MSNGQDNAAPSQQLALQLASMLGRDRIVNNEQLTSIMGQVAQARRLLDSIEQEAQNRHSQYQSMVQQLQARVNQGAEAEQLLRRLGTQAQQIQQAQQAQQAQQTQQTRQTQQAAPFVYGANVVQSPQSNGYYFQQPNPQQLSYQAAAAAATASVNIPGPSRLPEQQSSSYAAQVQHQATFTQYQPGPQTTQQPQVNQHSRQPTAGGPHRSRHYKDHHRHHVSVQPEAPMVPPPVVQQRHPPVAQQPSRPSQSPQVPPVAFPPLEFHGASRRSTVLAAGTSANAQKSPTTPSTSLPPARPPQAPQSAASQNTTFTQSQLAGITMEIHDLLKPRTREVIESVLPLVMRELHSRGKMGLNPHDIQVVYNWPLDPRIAPEVTPLFLAIVKKLLPLNSAQSGPIIRLILTSLNRRPSVANPNVQQLGSRPATPSTAPTVNGSAPNQPSSSAPPNGTPPVSRPGSAQRSTHPALPAGAPISEPPTAPMTNRRDQPQTLAGSPFSAVTSNGRSDSIQPPTLPANRPVHTVLNPPSSSQGNLPSTPPAGQRDTPLTPNTKTLARDILRSLGRPRGSLSSNASSQGSPGPSKLRVDQHGPPPASQPSVPAPDQQYREKEIIVIDDDSSVSSRPALDSMSVDEVSLPEKPVEASLPRHPSPPLRRPSPPQRSSSPYQHPPVEKPAPAVPATIDFDVVEIQTPGAMQMAYEEVQEMLQNGAPVATIDELIGIQTSNAPIPAPSSPRLSSAASPPPPSRSSTPADLVPAPRTPNPEPPPVAGPSKEPLFLASSPPSSSADVEDQMVIEHDENDQRSTDAFTPTGLLGFGAAPQQTASSLSKGKGRALEVDSDDDDSMPSLTSRRKRQKVDHVLVSDSEVVETSEHGEGARRRQLRREYKVYVDVPSMSGRYERYRRRVEQRGESGDRRKRARPLVVLSSASGSDVEVVEDDEIEESEDEEGRQQRLSEERQAVKLSVSRLRETPCHWRGCRAVLETAERLAEHLQLHASEKTSPPLICDWEDCNRRFSSHEKFVDHLSHHSEAELVCAYANCPVIALTPRELTLHHEKKHKGQRLKRGTGLYKPRLPQLGPLPRTLPAYKSVPLKVLPARISRNQHIWIGSKIAANITCYVHPGSRPNAAAPSRTSRRLADKVAEIERRAQAAGLDPTQAILHMSHGEYDAWLPEYRERGPRSCSNLPSSEVTEMVRKGLVIGAEYLEGDRRVPLEDDEEEDEIEEGSFDEEDHDIDEDAQGVGNESDQTIVIEDAFQAAVFKEVEVPDAVMADEHLPEHQADDEVRIEVLQPSSSASIPAAHGDQQDVDMQGDASVDGTRSGSENLSLPGWNVLRGDSVDVDGML